MRKMNTGNKLMRVSRMVKQNERGCQAVGLLGNREERRSIMAQRQKAQRKNEQGSTNGARLHKSNGVKYLRKIDGGQWLGQQRSQNRLNKGVNGNEAHRQQAQTVQSIRSCTR